jgi:hypothetical protein
LRARWGIWKQPFLEQRRNMVTITSQTSTCNKTTKVKRSRFCVCVCVCVCVFGFVLCWVLFYTFLSRLESFLSQRIWLLFTN